MKKTKIYTQSEIDDLMAGSTYEMCVFDSLTLEVKQLEECTFINCSFETCDLTGTKFNNSSFTGCNFSKANVAGCNFFSTTFVTNKLLGVVLSRENSFVGAVFTHCNFDYADMRGMDLSGLDLSKSSFF